MSKKTPLGFLAMHEGENLGKEDKNKLLQAKKIIVNALIEAEKKANKEN